MPRVPESPRIPRREDSPVIDYVATGREIGTSGGIFPENEVELAVGVDLDSVVAPRGGRSHGGAGRVDLDAILQTGRRSEALEEEIPEAARENPPSWTRGGGVDRPSGGRSRGKEEAQGQDGGEHEPYQGFPAHVRILFRAGRRQASSGPPRLPPDRIVCGPDGRRDHWLCHSTLFS